MHREIVIEWVWRFTWRPCSCEHGVRNRVSLEMQLQAKIERIWKYTWRPWSSELGNALRDCDWESLEMQLEAVIVRVWRYTSEAVIERDWKSTWKRWMDGAPGAETLCISSLTRKRGNVTRWLYLWPLMASWLMAVNCVGRHAGSWSYIQGSTRNHENESKTKNLGYAVLGVCCTWSMLYLVYAVLGVCCTWCMLYLVYAVLSVCCTRCMLYSVYACTRCQLMIMAWRDGEGWLDFVFCDDSWVVHKKVRDGGWRWEWCGGYEWISELRGTTCQIGLRRPRVGVITCWIGSCTCRIGNGKLTLTGKSLNSQFLMMICPISSHLSPSRPQLYHHLRTRS